jgi:regulatory protein
MSWISTTKQDLAGEPELTRAAVLRYLGRREYTASELRRLLQQRGAAPADIEAALSYARERGYQDDARAAESHIRRRLAYAPRGRALLRRELQELGVARELSAALLAEHYPPEAERELLLRILPKTELPSPGDAREARRQRQKMARRLLAKGFDQTAVLEALAEWLPLADGEDEFMD